MNDASIKNTSIKNSAGDSTIIWDALIRLSHLSYIILLPSLYWTATQGMMDIHQYLGISLLSIVTIRIFWGFFGSRTSRFSSFITSPKVVLEYSRSFFNRNSKHFNTHNPMGGYMVIVMLLLLLLQGGLGLFATDDIIFEGPLAHFVSYDLSVELTGWHHTLFDYILAAIICHILAVIWYQFYKRQALVQAMIHGKKPKVDQ
ncbi:MAG: cytochrome b/b6 domain-containing protein [Cellvibrionaceae bacterium]